MQKKLIIGANGYIGRHLANMLLMKDMPFHAVDIQSESIDGYHNYTQVDLCSNDLKTVIKDCDIVFMFAGKTGTLASFSEAESFVKSNEISLLRLLNTIKDNAPYIKIVFPSTRLVYKGIKNTKLVEDAQKEFKTIYAINKFACEQYLQMFHALYQIPYQIFRICVPYGKFVEGEQSFGTLSAMINNARKKLDLQVFGDGGQKRSVIHIEDLCNILISASFNNKLDNSIYNIAGPDILSVADIAKAVADKFGVAVKNVDWPAEHETIESGDTIFDETKLQNLQPYEYKHSFYNWITNF